MEKQLNLFIIDNIKENTGLCNNDIDDTVLTNQHGELFIISLLLSYKKLIHQIDDCDGEERDLFRFLL